MIERAPVCTLKGLVRRSRLAESGKIHIEFGSLSCRSARSSPTIVVGRARTASVPACAPAPAAPSSRPAAARAALASQPDRFGDFPPAVLPRQQRLTPSVLIKDTIRRGRRSRSGALVVHFLLVPDQEAPSRAAFAVGRSVGNSVDRHRITRQLRAITTPLLHDLPLGTQMVIRALPEARGASSGQLAADLHDALNKMSTGTTPTEGTPVQFSYLPGAGVDGSTGGAVEAAESAGARAGWRRVLWFIGWPIRALLLALIWVYRHTISPILPPTCRYHPSCSAYAFGALQRHGAAKGFVLASWRLLRCNPFTPGGLDPVPPRGRWRPDIEPDGTPRVIPTQVA